MSRKICNRQIITTLRKYVISRKVLADEPLYEWDISREVNFLFRKLRDEDGLERMFFPSLGTEEIYCIPGESVVLKYLGRENEHHCFEIRDFSFRPRVHVKWRRYRDNQKISFNTVSFLITASGDDSVGLVRLVR